MGAGAGAWAEQRLGFVTDQVKQPVHHYCSGRRSTNPAKRNRFAGKSPGTRPKHSHRPRARSSQSSSADNSCAEPSAARYNCRFGPRGRAHRGRGREHRPANTIPVDLVKPGKTPQPRRRSHPPRQPRRRAAQAVTPKGKRQTHTNADKYSRLLYEPPRKATGGERDCLPGRRTSDKPKFSTGGPCCRTLLAVHMGHGRHLHHQRRVYGSSSRMTGAQRVDAHGLGRRFGCPRNAAMATTCRRRSLPTTTSRLH